jgi:hypothetical protein
VAAEAAGAFGAPLNPAEHRAALEGFLDAGLARPPSWSGPEGGYRRPARGAPAAAGTTRGAAAGGARPRRRGAGAARRATRRRRGWRWQRRRRDRDVGHAARSGRPPPPRSARRGSRRGRRPGVRPVPPRGWPGAWAVWSSQASWPPARRRRPQRRRGPGGRARRRMGAPGRRAHRVRCPRRRTAAVLGDTPAPSPDRGAARAETGAGPAAFWRHGLDPGGRTAR